jgi:hypothetical protein
MRRSKWREGGNKFPALRVLFEHRAKRTPLTDCRAPAAIPCTRIRAAGAGAGAGRIGTAAGKLERERGRVCGRTIIRDIATPGRIQRCRSFRTLLAYEMRHVIASMPPSTIITSAKRRRESIHGVAAPGDWPLSLLPVKCGLQAR